MKEDYVFSCIHEPKVVLKTFKVTTSEKQYALCKDCTLLKPFNEFLLKEESIKHSKENFLSHRSKIHHD